MTIVMLGPADVDRIVELERRSFIPALQATAETVSRRFELGHLMFGIEESGELVGMHSVCYGQFDPDDFEAFPKREQDYCMQQVPAEYNAVLSYNLEVAPTSRGRAHSEQLFRATVERAISDGCRYVVGCSRIPSYAGSDSDSHQERFSRIAPFRESIDRYLQEGVYPRHEELMLDPLLNLYYRLGTPTKGRFHWILQDFAPYDRASGGMRVILYGELRHWSDPHQPSRTPIASTRN